MSNKDYYQILGISENATDDEIKKVYRKLAMQYHPDKNQDRRKEAEERFKALSEAYYVLGDKKRRTEYDAYKKGYGPKMGGDFSGAEGFDFSEILKQFGGFGRASRRRTSRSASMDDIFSIFSNMGTDDNGEDVYMSNGFRNDYGPAKEHTDINATLAIPQSVAQTGGEVLFSHEGKKITLKIKPNTSSGQKLRIRGQGTVCRFCGHAGDLIVTLKTK